MAKVKKYLTKENYPKLYKEWCYEKNLGAPEDYTYGSTYMAWWACSEEKCQSLYKMSINNRTNKLRNSGCPYCSNKLVNHTNSIKTTHPQLYEQLLLEWDPILNYFINQKELEDYTYGSQYMASWICSKENCHSSWLVEINHRTNEQRLSGCPYCAGKSVNHTNCLLTTHPELAKEYSKNNKLMSNEITYGMGILVNWICPDCHSEYSMSPNARTGFYKSGCSYCAGKKVNHTNCLSNLDPTLASEWDYERNIGLLPDYITCGSDRKIWWMCKSCQKSWQATVCDRCGIDRTGCPNCGYTRISKLELQWLQYLNIPNDPEHRQVKILPNRRFRVDGYDPINKIVYEFYGDYWHGNPQIYKSNDYNYLAHKTFGELYQKTSQRERILKNAGYQIISIWESDWKNSKKILTLE